MAYPDTYVRISDDWICKILPYVGIGTRQYLKAGHAALVLIENATGLAKYYDFGRYITPNGKGRVRSAVTDIELQLPFSATIDRSHRLSNLEQFLLWLEANPKKTHGDGRLIASVCEFIDHEKAEKFILELQGRGSVRYSAFKDGSNCSRFVTDTILQATDNSRIISALKRNKRFTPSTVGNVEKAATGQIFMVQNGQIEYYNGSAFKENITNYFHRRPNRRVQIRPIWTADKRPKLHFLSGIGSSAYFSVELLEEDHGIFSIKRYDEERIQDFEGCFKVDDNSFNIHASHQFVYDSNCQYCHIEQNNKVYRFDKIEENTSKMASLKRRVRLA
ncbi:DUF6695 family protein [Sungkyunkwania multivorans]